MDLPCMRTRARTSASGTLPSTHEELSPELAQMWCDRVNKVVSQRNYFADKVAELLPNLFLGGVRHAKHLDTMKRLGVTHVLNCAADQCSQICSQFYAERKYNLAIDVHLLPANDDPGYPLLANHFQEAFEFIEGSRRSGGTVLVHCYQGVNRSAAICVAYLVQALSMPLLHAVRHVFQARPCILSNRGFQAQLVEFAHARGQLRVDPEEVEEDLHPESSPGSADSKRARRARTGGVSDSSS
eukprot:RCo039073